MVLMPSYSPMPPTCGWRSSICSRSVVPLRGMPTTSDTPRTAGARGAGGRDMRPSRVTCACASASRPSRSNGEPVVACRCVARSNARRYSAAASRSRTASKPAMRRTSDGALPRAIASRRSTVPARSVRTETRAVKIAARGSSSHGPPAATSASNSSRRLARCRTSASAMVASTVLGAFRWISPRSRSIAAWLRPRRWSTTARIRWTSWPVAPRRRARSTDSSAARRRPRPNAARARPNQAAASRGVVAVNLSANPSAGPNDRAARSSFRRSISAGLAMRRAAYRTNSDGEFLHAGGTVAWSPCSLLGGLDKGG